MSKHEECQKDEEHDPKGCTPEQIRACHVEVEEHPCGVKIGGGEE
jgi:hypothetical protein